MARGFSNRQNESLSRVILVKIHLKQAQPRCGWPGGALAVEAGVSEVKQDLRRHRKELKY